MLNRFVLIFLLVVTLFILGVSSLFAEEVHFKNGDRITGKIIKEDKNSIVIQTDTVGQVSIKRGLIKEIVSEKTAKLTETTQTAPKLCKGEVSLGYNEARGNTENAQLSMGICINRKTEHNEFTVKGNSFYSSSNDQMDAQKWYGMIRYAFSFREKKWYNFYKVENDHDRFANIDYRVVPSGGLGYWFSDTPQWKAMVEGAIGLEYTHFRDDSKDDDEAIFIGRVFLEKELFSKAKLLQDISVYPSVSDVGDYRVHSETTLTNPISANSSLRFSFIDDYNSKPTADAEKNDIRLISSIVYAF